MILPCLRHVVYPVPVVKPAALQPASVVPAPSTTGSESTKTEVGHCRL